MPCDTCPMSNPKTADGLVADMKALSLAVTELSTEFRGLKYTLLGNGRPGKCQQHDDSIDEVNLYVAEHKGMMEEAGKAKERHTRTRNWALGILAPFVLLAGVSGLSAWEGMRTTQNNIVSRLDAMQQTVKNDKELAAAIAELQNSAKTFKVKQDSTRSYLAPDLREFEKEQKRKEGIRQ